MKKNLQISETRIWLDDNGTVKTRQIIHESRDEINFERHPTETRVVPDYKRREGKTIFSQEIMKKRDVPVDIFEQALLADLKITWDLQR